MLKLRSDLAVACPHCGYPIQQAPDVPPSPAADEAIPWNERPLPGGGEAVLLRRFPNPKKRMKPRRTTWHLIQQRNATPVAPATKAGLEAYLMKADDKSPPTTYSQ